MYSILLLIPFAIIIILLVRRVWVLANPFMRRGIVGGFIGIFIGWMVLYLCHSRRQDGVLVFWGHPMNNLAIWIFIDFPFILGALIITGLVIGWILAMIINQLRPARAISAMTGIVIGGVLGAVAAGIVARVFDYLTLKDFQLELYGYYFVGCAAIIGATSGAIAGAAAGLTEREPQTGKARA